MKRWWVPASRSALVLFGCCMSLVACGKGGVGSEGSTESGSDADSNSSSDADADAGSDADSDSSSDTEDTIGWVEIGWGDGEYVPMAQGDTFAIVRGGQGAEMFPMPLRGAEFYLPGNPTSWMDETGPLVDFEMDIEGFNDGPLGHFKRIANYTLDWVVLEDGTYLSSYLPIIVPDGIDSAQLDGKPAHILLRLRPHQQPNIELELDVVISAMSEPLPG
jgi:hypothetical protein